MILFLLYDRIGPGGFQLLIIQADPSQEGIYTCYAYSKAGEARQQFRLTVLGKNTLMRSFSSSKKSLIAFICFSAPKNSTRKYKYSRYRPEAC
jgi:hypothetical protein